MNIKERILKMDKIYAGEYDLNPVDDIKELLITIITKFQLFEPCQYIDEDEEWVTFILTPPDDSLGSQIMCLNKSEIVSFGICNEKNVSVEDITPKSESESLYQ